MDNRQTRQEAERADVRCSLSVDFSASLSHLTRLTRALEGILELTRLDECIAYEIVLAAHEAITNSIEHAQLRDAARALTVRVSIDRCSFSCEIDEKNPHVRKAEVGSSSVNEFIASGGERGFGTALMRAYMDDVRREVTPTGYRWVLRRKLPDETDKGV